ncbi:hypothetical protein VaNZ11_008829 [Volvox africanus]|uniref:Uncharacterized protein n=1 Tax=Volvox africanus TaxID=51714 RepID=A0ABQ5S7N6_9CHLO|nr:hypothetical protein VaNZ11_008829 [Volvox africanus]
MAVLRCSLVRSSVVSYEEPINQTLTPSACLCHQFLAAPGSRHAVLEHQDDMLWFVAAPDALSLKTPKVWLRRNTSADLPSELRPGGSAFSSVDWAASAQLNLVVQAKYILTVVQCRQECLAAIAQDHASPGPCTVGNHRQQPDAVIAQRRVFASPMAADVNLEDAKSGQSPQACYPDVCFAVDNYEDAFQDVVGAFGGAAYLAARQPTVIAQRQRMLFCQLIARIS